ncbi:phospholipid carrier-dependent glycosyltransferase [Candidatus Microgenomates bacterium]|nr:MAG: phospholipid carrier-dependent glycosyltransferase [Candidatus Microgenomates bacterium]
MIKNSKLFIILILILTACLRFYQLGDNPPSLDWDEASLGYNAYSILKTGKDEFGRYLPVSIRSFEDYKPAMYTYLTVPSVYIFGLNEFAVRLPSAILGVLTVFVCYFLVKELFNQKIALLATFLLAISPWHLQFSRVAFESNASLFFVFTGLYCYLKGRKKGIWFIPAAILVVLSFYTYHSPRLVVPLILFGWTIYYREQIVKQWRYVLAAVVIGLFFLVPFFQEIFTSGRARLSSVTVVTVGDQLNPSIARIEADEDSGDSLGKLTHNRRVEYAKAIVKGYVDHWNLDFLFLTGDAPDRHHAKDSGMLYIWEAPFILFGIISLLRKKMGFPVFWWYIVAPAASALTTGTPHAVRALLFLPTYQVFTAVGAFSALGFLRNNQYYLPQLVKRAAFGVVLSLIGINLYWYFASYYVYTPIEAAKDWQYGYKQAVAVAREHEDSVENIVMTYRYDQPHIFVLFYNQIDPSWYQLQWQGGEVLRAERQFGKYTFRNIDWEKDAQLTNTLLVGTPSEIPDGLPGHIADIYFPDGEIAFRVVKR